MAEDKETVIQRVINFLYDALDRFRDTMSDLNQNVSVLMDSLKKAEGDLAGTGYQATGTDRSAVLTTISKRGAQSSSSSREKLISLLSGQRPTPPRPAATARAAAPRAPAAAGPPRRPAAGPPRPPVGAPPAAGPPRAPAAGPPRPPVAAPPAVGPPQRPAAGPPRPPVAAPPAAGPPRPAAPAAAGPPRPAAPTLAGPPRPAGPAAGGGAPTISGLRDEMLKELKRLKSIMKGEK